MSVATPPTPSGPSVAPAPIATNVESLVGELEERGVVRHDTVRVGRWTARGTAKVAGEVAVDSADLSGHLVVGAGVRAGSLRVRGTAEVAGAVAVRGALYLEGSLRAGSTVSAQTARLAGSTHAVGAIEVEKNLEIRGDLWAPSVRAETLTIRGGAEVGGTVVAGTLRAELDRRSSFGSIRARSVSIRLGSPSPVERLFGGRATATIGRIEAESVDLERVDVEFVRGTEIRLGRDAHVTAFEGRIARRHPTSRIGPESRSPPPHGLRR